MVKDKGKGAENLIWLASRQSGRADPSLVAADDILAALTGRIAELEARVAEVLAEVDPELPPVDSKHGDARSAPKPDAILATDKIRDARVEADADLTRASEERRMLANEMRLLREAFQEARRSQLPAARSANAAEAQIAPDLRAAIADEMRSLLTELLADFRSRALAPPPVAHVPGESEPTVQSVAAAPTIVEQVVEDLTTAPPVLDVVATEPAPIVEHVDPPALRTTSPLIDEYVGDRRPAPALDTLATDAAPIGTSGSIVEHVDELVRPSSKPLSYEPVADLQEPEPVAPADVFPVEAAPTQSAGAIVEELLRSESPTPLETEDFQVAFPETPRIIDEHVFGPAEPVAPVIDEYVEELRLPEAPPLLEAIELTAAPAEPIEPTVDEYIEELRLPEAPPPIETIELTAAPAEPIVDDYVVPASDFTMTPPAPTPSPDPRLAALWDATSLPTEAESAPPTQPEAASFITEDVIAETRPLEIPEEPYPAQEFPLEQTIELASPPQVEFVPPPPVEFAPEPPALIGPEPQTWAAPLITEPEPALTFPELRVADERGLHQIQIVISPIHSFPRLLDTEARIRALSTVSAVHLRDFRNGIATFAVAVGEAISAAEFGAVIQMLDDLHLRLEGTTQTSVELRAEDEPPIS